MYQTATVYNFLTCPRSVRKVSFILPSAFYYIVSHLHAQWLTRSGATSYILDNIQEIETQRADLARETTSSSRVDNYSSNL